MIGLLCFAGIARQVRRDSPAAPPVREPAAQSDQAPHDAHRNDFSDPQLTTDWPRLFGPTGDCRIGDVPILTDWPGEFPPILWRKSIGTGYSAPITSQNQVILQHRINDAEMVECLELDSGQAVWSSQTPTSFKCEYPTYSSGPYSTPTTDGTDVYVQTTSGELRCLSVENGDVRWVRHLADEFQVPKLGYPPGHSPLIEGNLLILNLCGTASDSGIVALDRMTGSTVWQTLNTGSSAKYGTHSSPVAAEIHGLRLVFVLSAAELVCLRPQTGDILWTIPVGTGSGDTPNSTTPLVCGDCVLVSVFRADTFCLRIRPDGSYDELWRNRRALESVFNPLTAMGSVVYGWHSFDRTLRCVDLHTGNVRWKQRTVFERGNQIATSQHLILVGETGHLGIIHADADQFRPLRISETPLLDSPCYTSPAWTDGHLLIRNESELLCLDLSP
ncbi:MAG: PQQ-binding-like beta-propeller repeat protein [Planctomycetaceae bacterium]